ncbi:ATP-binding protein [Sedimentibacter sp. B4]|uniref:ATP-binding protein n=1 Tax=Sedimentibacter sp. B4 TaxID=304766 RepID=UPI0002F62EB4|nr:ATP-binding protein [Sedimentibacter sp. B4]
MSDRELVMQYIEDSLECEWVDFKEKFYALKNDKENFIIDIVSFANNLQQKDKFLIFGVEDGSCNICGIDTNTMPDIAILENLLFEKVEPKVTIILNSVLIENKKIAYIKIPKSNENQPYMLKNECGKAKKGDIFIRKGSVNTKATRMDLDDIYLNRHFQEIKPYDNYILIAPIHMKNILPENLTYGKMDIEIINLSNRPLLINNGWVEFENQFGKIERSIFDILPSINIRDNPFEVPPNTHFKREILFDFLSSDCITLHFDDKGYLNTKTYVNTIFEDVNGKFFRSEPKEFFIIAKGEILHKIKLLYKKFRQYLIKRNVAILSAIELNQDEVIDQLLSVDFSLVQPGYVLENPEFPEYDICANIIRKANEVKSGYVVEQMLIKGLPQDFVDFALGRH